jgi:hypothetical protein
MEQTGTEEWRKNEKEEERKNNGRFYSYLMMFLYLSCLFFVKLEEVDRSGRAV